MFTEDDIHNLGLMLEEKGLSHSQIDSYFEHHGVKGMHWGIRNDHVEGVSNKTNRQAKKDAHEFARAKLFYGEGAGTRRKLIKNKVEGKSKLDPSYKKAFDHHYAKQDLAGHTAKAISERHRKDVKNSTAKTARGVKNVMLRNGAPVSLAAAAIGTAALNPRVRTVVKSSSKTAFNEAKRRVNAVHLQRLLKQMGV